MHVVIIIPGATTKTPHFFNWVTSRFYNHYGVDIEEDYWEEDLKKYLEESTNLRVILFRWSGGISEKWSIRPAAKRLVYLLQSLKDYSSITIFTKSLGGRLAELALDVIPEHTNIDKLIYVSVPHMEDKKLPKNVKIVNVYSKEDTYIDLANNVLYFGRGVKVLNNAENIELKGFRHSDFNKNREIEVDGKKIKLFEFYKNLMS